MAHFRAESDFKNWAFWRRWFGARSEKAAAAFLRRLGWTILGTNQADRQGEIDLLALDGSTLVIVEVRSTSGIDPHTAAASVDARKQKRLTAAALRFLTRRKLLGINLRYDILALAWPVEQREPTILHIRHAFEPTDRFQMFS